MVSDAGRRSVRRAARLAVTVLMAAVVLGASSALAPSAHAQVAPSEAEASAYRGLFRAVWRRDRADATRLVRAGANPNARDASGRTALHVAAHRRDPRMVALLVALGATANALDAQRHDAVTIAAVNGDLATMKAALDAGNRATNVTSPYDGTALIASAHLGHVEIVRELTRRGAPLDHVNNLGWTALIEAVVLGDGGPRHRDIVRILLAAGADAGIADRNGLTPRALAVQRGYPEMAALFD